MKPTVQRCRRCRAINGRGSPSIFKEDMKMTRRIMFRTQGYSIITVSLILGPILLTPTQTRADKISSSDTAKTLGEIATASAFPLSSSTIVDILNAGKPVSANTTTTYRDGTTQTANLLIVPDPSAGTVTITKDINLANGKTETVVDTATVSGNTISNKITRTLPDGSIQSTDVTDVTKGTKTIMSGSAVLPGGGTLAITGEKVERGSESITALTITGQAGKVYHDRIVTTPEGTLSESKTNTVTGPGAATMAVSSLTRALLGSSTVGRSFTLAGLKIPAAGLGSQTLNLQAQVLAPASTASDTGGTVLPVAAPEPQSLVIFSVILAAAALCHRLR
jgi:hypothetical protein